MVARQALTATIANGAALSSAVDLLGYELAALGFPASWTTADVTLQTSHDGVTFWDVFSGTAEATIDAAASQWTAVPEDLARGLGRYIKIRSGTSGSPTNQGGFRRIVVYGTTR